MHLLKTTLLPLLSSLSVLLISSCVSGTDYEKRVVVPVTQKRVESAIRSTYFVPSGADVSVRYSENSVFYVAKGATFRAFGKKAKDSKIIADKGANLFLTPKIGNSYSLDRVTNAESRYREDASTTGSRRSGRSGQTGVRRPRYYTTGYYPYYNDYYGYYGGYGYGPRYGYGYGYHQHRKQEYIKHHKPAIQGALKNKF